MTQVRVSTKKTVLNTHVERPEVSAEVVRMPVNTYDPATASIKDEIRATIESDLSSLGRVRRMTGSIVSTHRNGTVLTDVAVHLSHRRLRSVIVVEVTWDDVEERLRYRSPDGLEFTPPAASGYESTSPEKKDQEIVQRVFARLDEHPAAKNVKFDSPSQFLLAPTALFGMGGMGGAGLILLTPADALGLVGAATCWVVGLGWGARNSLLTHRALYRHYDNVTGWNENPSKVISDVFFSSQEESEFMDAFYTATSRYGLKSVGLLEVTKRRDVDWDDDLDMNKIVEADRFDSSLNDWPFRSYMLQFTARMSGRPERQIIYWDGLHFYLRTSRPVRRHYMQPHFFPLPLPMNPKEKRDFIKEIAVDKHARRRFLKRHRNRIQEMFEDLDDCGHMECQMNSFS